MLKQFFEPTPRGVLKWLFALKSFIGVIAVSAYVQKEVKLGFWLLVGGAAIDFFIQGISGQKPGDYQKNMNNMLMVLVIATLAFTLSSCGVTRTSSVSRTDSSWLTYKQVPYQIAAQGPVSSSLDMDSLVSAWKAENSSLLKKIDKQFTATGQLSLNPQQLTAALNDYYRSHPAPVIPQKSIVRVTDSSAVIQLQYYMDQYGKLIVSCGTKDQTIQLLVAENNKLRTEKTSTIVEKKTAVWFTWVFLGMALASILLNVMLFAGILRPKL